MLEIENGNRQILTSIDDKVLARNVDGVKSVAHLEPCSHEEGDTRMLYIACSLCFQRRASEAYFTNCGHRYSRIGYSKYAKT